MERRAQDLPVNMIVLTALALLVLVVVGAFFISGFGQASSSVNIIPADQAECNGICNTLTTSAFNYNDCDSFTGINQAILYGTQCANSYGACTVTLRNGDSCPVDVIACTTDSDCTAVSPCDVPTCGDNNVCVCVAQ
jgi:hypothetical protein